MDLLQKIIKMHNERYISISGNLCTGCCLHNEIDDSCYMDSTPDEYDYDELVELMEDQ